MNNSEYIEKVFQHVGRVLVDTSTLMTPGFQHFIHNNKEHLVERGKKIIIPRAVYTELARHLGSNNHDKNKHAIDAVSLIATNEALFQIESHELTEEEVAHAFADAELLSDLTLHRNDWSQLLISNDRNLSSDAFGLNQQKSCMGRKILVCYVNYLGELQCCDCVNDTNESETAKVIIEPVNNTPEKVKSNSQQQTEMSEISIKEWGVDLKSYVLGVSSVAAIYGIYKSTKLIISNMR